MPKTEGDLGQRRFDETVNPLIFIYKYLNFFFLHFS